MGRSLRWKVWIVQRAVRVSMPEVRGVSRAMRALMIISIVVPIGLYGAVSWYLRNESLRDGMVHVSQTVRMLEEHALRVFEAQQLIIDRVDRHIAGMGWTAIRESADVHQYLREVAASSPHVDGLWLVPPDGRTANSADQFPFPEVTVADRDYFRALEAGDVLHFGEMIIGRTKGNLNFNLSRRRTPRDRFDGLILVTASIDYFTDFWADASLYPDHVAGLFRSDGAILARFPMQDSIPSNLSPTASPLLQAFATDDDGVYRSRSSLDGSQRLYAYSRVGGFPIIVGFGVDEAAVLTRWRQDLVWHGLIALVAAMLLGGSVLVAFRQSRELGIAVRSWRSTAEELRHEVDRRLRAEDVAAEKERLLTQLHDATRQRQAILDNMVEGVAAYDAAGRVIYCNEAARRILRLAPDDLVVLDRAAAEQRITRPDGTLVEPAETPVRRLLRGETLHREELQVSFNDDTAPVVCRFRGTMLLDGQGRVTGAVLTFSDVTEQKAEDERRATLMAELDHRVRNMLATIMAMVRLSNSGAASREVLVQNLTGRIEAMARTHGLLTQSGWRGAWLGEIVRDEVQPYAVGGRIVIDGLDDVWLPPKEAVDLALVIHELATNAAKHGAWSSSAGQVHVSWSLESSPPRVRVVWRERGGPALTERIDSGFGTTLIRSAFRDADAGVELRHEPEGVVCEMRIPVRRLSGWGPHSAFAEPTRAVPSPSGMHRLRVLVAEDEPIVRMELVQILEEAGAVVVGEAATTTQAVVLARKGGIDAAILDLNLNGESIGPVAEMLHARGVAIIFASGYQDLDGLPPALRHLPRLQKPVSPAELVTALASAMQSASVRSA
jgi:PAS domain S-box-containing protein